jgi:hypothetical protein
MTSDEARQYAEICTEITDSLFMHAARVAGESVKKKVRYKLACEAIAAACYQGLFGAALKVLQNSQKAPTGMTVKDAWSNREVHELIAHEIVRNAVHYMGTLDHRYTWTANILKRKKP